MLGHWLRPKAETGEVVHERPPTIGSAVEWRTLWRGEGRACGTSATGCASYRHVVPGQVAIKGEGTV